MKRSVWPGRELGGGRNGGATGGEAVRWRTGDGGCVRLFGRLEGGSAVCEFSTVLVLDAALSGGLGSLR